MAVGVSARGLDGKVGSLSSRIALSRPRGETAACRSHRRNGASRSRRVDHATFHPHADPSGDAPAISARLPCCGDRRGVGNPRSHRATPVATRCRGHQPADSRVRSLRPPRATAVRDNRGGPGLAKAASWLGRRFDSRLAEAGAAAERSSLRADLPALVSPFGHARGTGGTTPRGPKQPRPASSRSLAGRCGGSNATETRTGILAAGHG